MKTEELMIGEIVRQNGSGLVLTVSAITPPYVQCAGEDGQFHENTIEPIAISVKILEKNGFKLVGSHTSHWQICGNCYDDIQISGVPDPKHHAALTLNAHKTSHTGCGHGFYRFINDMQIQYVHELQHIMRICEIGKDLKV